MTCQLDHLVFAARTLNEGIGHVSRLLGVAPQAGGKHARMGTHNALLSLGPECYLEVIAVDPDASAPPQPRWFGLDAFKGVPRLVHWVARCADIDALRPPRCQVLDMERGDFRWRFAVTPDGVPELDGTVPALIQWQEGGHPCNRLHDHGLRLRRLTLGHGQPQRVQGELARLGLADQVSIAANGPALKADIQVGGKLVELV
ncbi:MAG: VOC family protein [Magnetospirillum sp.]|nr:VOC family protein [Magnetospirillum sp.]